MNHLESLIRILASFDSRLLMTRNEYIAELASIIPFLLAKKDIAGETYSKVIDLEFKSMKIRSDIKVTNNPQSEELEPNTLAYHRVRGMITSDSDWRFSSKQLQRNILAAESNPNISGHFFHISSGGGEAWYLDQLAKTIRETTKPRRGFMEKICGSAGYYIASQTEFISAATPFDLVGCMGTMISFMDIQPMFEKWGMKFIEEYANNSDLKNKKYNDLRTGKPEQFINEELDPLRDQFVADVKLCRPTIAALPEDHPVLRGETYYADKAIENGLIDIIEPFDAALERAYEAATAWHNENDKRRKALRYL